MLSAIVLLSQKQRLSPELDPLVAAARSLAGLVEASVAGLIADVTLAGPSDIGLGTIADHAGCGLAEGAAEAQWLRRALPLTKTPTLLVLCAGYAPGDGFNDELRRFQRTAPVRPALWHATPRTWPERLFPALGPLAGAIAPTALWQAQPELGFLPMVRALRGRRLSGTMHRLG